MIRFICAAMVLAVFLHSFQGNAQSCMQTTCGTATVCSGEGSDAVCHSEPACWLTPTDGMCSDDSGGSSEGGGSTGGGGGTVSNSYDSDFDGRMDCWRGTVDLANNPPSSPYGTRPDRFHYGVDITSGADNFGKGANARALASGTVVAAGFTSGNGNYVKINHDDGRASYYMHLETIDSAMIEGARTSPGQVVGGMNCTGSCYSSTYGANAVQGTHLHLEVRTTHNALRDTVSQTTTIDPTTYASACN